MHHGEISNTMCLLKCPVFPENFHQCMNWPNMIKLEWIFIQSKKITVVDKNNVRNYHGIIN